MMAVESLSIGQRIDAIQSQVRALVKDHERAIRDAQSADENFVQSNDDINMKYCLDKVFFALRESKDFTEFCTWKKDKKDVVG